MKPKKQNRKWIWIIIILAILITAGWIGFGQLWTRTGERNAPQTGDIVTAELGNLSATATATGQIISPRIATLSLTLSGQVDTLFVEVGDLVQTGDPLIQLDTTELEREVQNAEQAVVIQEANLEQLQEGASLADLAAAQATVASAQASLDSLLAGADPAELAAAEANLRAAQAQVGATVAQRDQLLAGASSAEILAAQTNLDSARQQRDNLQEAYEQVIECFTDPTGQQFCPGLGPTEENLRFALQSAEASLALAQAQYDALLDGTPQEQINAATAQIGSAVAQREAAQIKLDLLLQGATAAEMANAEAQLAQAQATLKQLEEGPTAEQLIIAEAQLEQTRINWQRAQHNLEKGTLRAPFAGTVIDILVKEGEFANGFALTLADTNQLEIALNVDELDLATLEVGQSASITLESFPDQPIAGEVITIAPLSNRSDAGTVTYEVRLRLAQTDLPIRLNMTANADLITATRQNVLLIPNRAIQADRSKGIYTVNRLIRQADGTLTSEQVEITIGLRDNGFSEILSGIKLGDELVVGDFLPVVENIFEEP